MPESVSVEKHGVLEAVYQASDIDLHSFHEKRAGRLVIDPGYVSFPYDYLGS